MHISIKLFFRVAQKLDVTGILASIFAAACGVGGMISVPLVGFLTKESDPTVMVWVTLGLTLTQACLAVPTWYTARYFKKKETVPTVQTEMTEIK